VDRSDVAVTLGAELELSGAWQATPAADEVRRASPDPSFDDSTWTTLTVPGHWRSSPDLAAHDGPILHRRRFEHPLVSSASRAWLTLGGVFSQSDVWLDGAYLGDTEGYFVPQRFDVTDAMRARTDHVVTVEAACTPDHDGVRQRSLDGVLGQRRGWNPGGIWRPIGVVTTGPVAIVRLRVLCREASAERAVLVVEAGLDALTSGPAAVSTTVTHDGRVIAVEGRDQTLAAGTNTISWTVTVDQPPLWWPWAMGDQPLVDVDVAVSTNDGEPSDHQRVVTGLRQVRMTDWLVRVNGERMFCKGVNVLPTSWALGEVDASLVARDVQLAREAGLDLVRVRAHVARPELYDAANELGVLLWQDLPLRGTYARSIAKQARRSAAAMVDLLGHHPSVALWCAHDAPRSLDDRAVSRTRRVLRGQAPTWNRVVLDSTLRRTLRANDPTRPVIAHSGVPPHVPGLKGTDSHLSLGWEHGDDSDLADLARVLPVMVRWVGEFGAQAPGADTSALEAAIAAGGRWPVTDWERIADEFGLDHAAFERNVPPDAYASFGEWKSAAQAYQADLLQRQIEILRRLKYSPTGGFCYGVLADPAPAVSSSVLDHARRGGPAFDALAEACRPVIVVADRLPSKVECEQPLALDVHVVSDLREAIPDALVTARLSWAGGGHAWRWRGDIDADSVTRIGMVRFQAPERPGHLTLDLELAAGDHAASNRDSTTVVTAS
jgi:beta-mannosidase